MRKPNHRDGSRNLNFRRRQWTLGPGQKGLASPQQLLGLVLGLLHGLQEAGPKTEVGLWPNYGLNSLGLADFVGQSSRAEDWLGLAEEPG